MYYSMQENGDDKGERKPTIVEVRGTATAVATATATATVRRNFSSPHLRAASHIAQELEAHEREYSGSGWGPHFDRCTWYCSAALILSYSAIEAAVDETEDDLGIASEMTSLLERAPTLDRIQALLAHRSAECFDKGGEPFQSAELLRSIRNGLVHPKAEWDNASVRNKSLSRKIVGAGLPLSPFQQDPNLAFPHGCMSAGIAKWSADTARAVIKQMRERLGLPCNV